MKFRLVFDTIHFDHPTSDYETVQEGINEYFREERGNLQGKHIQISLVMENGRWFHSPEFFVNEARVHQEVMKLMQMWQSSQQNYEEEIRWKVAEIRISIGTPTGGCNNLNIHLSGWKDQRLQPHLYTPPNENDNNCGLWCIGEHMTIFIDHKMTKKEVHLNMRIRTYAADAARLRKQFFGAFDGPLDQSHLKVLSRAAKFPIAVYTNDERKFFKLYEVGSEFRKDVKLTFKDDQGKTISLDTANTCVLLLMGGHYCYVYPHKLNMLNYEKCWKCSHWFADVVKHLKKCKHIKGGKSRSIVSLKAKKPKKDEHGEPSKRCSALGTKNKTIMYADFETFPSGPNKEHTVYAAALKIGEGDVVVFGGQSSLDQFMEELGKLYNDSSKKYVLVFYNGSRFDLFMVINWLDGNRSKWFVNKTATNDVEFISSGGSYKKLSWCNITCWDLNLHLVGSLKANCAAFGLAQQDSKMDFDHQRIRSWTDVDACRSGPDGWEIYLKQDVVALSKLYEVYANTMWNAIGVEVDKCLTSSSLSYTAWRVSLSAYDRTCEDIKTGKKTRVAFELPLLNYEENEWLRRSVYGGRCYPVKQYFVSEGPDDYLMDLDAVSLYPSASAADPDTFYCTDDVSKKDEYEFCRKWLQIGWFPCGSHLTVVDDANLAQRMREIIDLKFEQLFFAEVDMSVPKDLVHAVLPRRDSKTNAILWDLEEIKGQVYGCVDIFRALRKGYKLTKIHKLMYFTDKKRLLQGYFNKIFKMKQEAQKDTPLYALSKLLMNALYGKMIQKPITSHTTVVHTWDQMEKVRDEYEIVGKRLLNHGEEEKEALLLECSSKDKNEKVTKPSYIGSLILQYSRAIMDKFYDEIGAYHNLEDSFFRGDTDSMIVHRKQYEQLEKFLGKEFGCLGLDINGRIIRFVEVQPKAYICEYIPNGGGEPKTHMRLKGMPERYTRGKLTVEDFEALLFGRCSRDQPAVLKDEHGHEVACLHFREGEVVYQQAEKFKRTGYKLTKAQELAGVSMNSVSMPKFERTVNKTKWRKRWHIPDHKQFASLPYGHRDVKPDDDAENEPAGDLEEERISCSDAVAQGGE